MENKELGSVSRNTGLPTRDESAGGLSPYPHRIPLQLGCADQFPNLLHSTSSGPSKEYVSWQPKVAVSL